MNAPTLRDLKQYRKGLHFLTRWKGVDGPVINRWDVVANGPKTLTLECNGVKNCRPHGAWDCYFQMTLALKESSTKEILTKLKSFKSKTVREIMINELISRFKD